MKKWLLRLGLVVIGPVVMLLLLEAVWQAIGDPRIGENEVWLTKVAAHSRLGVMGMFELDEDEAVSFRLKPGFEAKIGKQTYRINSHGMRGPEVSKQRISGVKRILLVGDSYAFGYGVDESATVSAQLQARLSVKHTGIEVLNMGVPAYHTGQELRRLELDGMSFTPDLVVLIYYPNDNIQQTLMYDPRFRVIHFDEMPFSYGTRHFLSRSIVYSRITKGYTQYLTRSGSLETRGLRHWSTTRERLRKMTKICKDAGCKFLLVALPTLSYSRELFDPDHEINKAHDRMLLFTEDQGIATVDMRSALLARKKPIEALFVAPEPPRRDTHFNQAGYRVLVDSLTAAIESKKYL
jgi:lysophospholipase L1-like esterase